MSDLQLGQYWGGAFGAIRYTAEGQSGVMRTEGTLIDIPIDERNLKRQEVGSDMSVASFTWAGDLQLTELLALQTGRTASPVLRWPRLVLTEHAYHLSGIAGSVSDSQSPDEVTAREVVVAPQTEWVRHSPGILFNWEIHATAGVSVATDGPWINVGALAAGETFDIWALNLHHPAPTTSSTAWLIESATDGIGTGLATVSLLTAATATPSWELVSIDGPWTPAFLRLGIELPVDGLFWPVCLVTKRST